MKRPAYARELVEMRRAGTHPPVDIVIGRLWTPRPGTPVRLALAQEDAAQPMDFSCVAGLDVTVIDRTNCSDWTLACQVAGAAADYARSVRVWIADGDAHDIASMAFGSRTWDRVARVFRWPSWWSDGRDRAYRDRRDAADRARGARLLREHETRA